MPRDNFENFLKDKLGELDETLPPGISWNKALGWNQLQSKLPAKRRPKFVWYQAAAVTLLLMSTLLFLKILPEKSDIIARRDLITKSRSKSASFNIPVDLPHATIPDSGLVAASLNPTFNKKLVALPKSKRNRVGKKNLVIPVKQENGFKKNPRNDIINEVSVPLEKAAEPLRATALLNQKPIKITVVLGGKSRRELVVSHSETNTKVNRRKNKRLKLQVGLPGEPLAEDSSLAATTNQLPNRSALRAEINL